VLEISPYLIRLRRWHRLAHAGAEPPRVISRISPHLARARALLNEVQESLRQRA
jgi:hypothetical protein